MISIPKPAIAVALTGWRLDDWISRLRQSAPEREIVLIDTAGDPLPASYYLFCWKPKPEILRSTPAPLMILSAGAGVDHILDHSPPPGVPITRIVDPDLTSRMVEHVVLHCLYHLRRMDEAALNQRQHRWRAAAFASARQVTVGLMGTGEMGRACASGLAALGFNVIGWSRTPKADLPFRAYSGEREFDQFLSRSNILVSLLPSTPATRGLIDRGVFRRLPREAPFGAPVFISAGRGNTVVEADLMAALQDGTLRAASLDVFVKEPLAADSPFWDLGNAVITPHNAADSHPDAIVEAVLEEIRRFEAGEPLRHPVDRLRGY